jgi:hypothetical protein
MITFKANNSDVCLNIINELTVSRCSCMSDGITADRITRLILHIKRSNQNTKILVIAGEDSDKNKDIRL